MQIGCSEKRDQSEVIQTQFINNANFSSVKEVSEVRENPGNQAKKPFHTLKIFKASSDKANKELS